MIGKTLKALGLAAGLAAGLIGPWAAAQAQGFPEREIVLVIAGSPGSSADILARLLADNMSKRLGKPVLVESKTGAGGAIAMEYTAQAEPDGHTLMLDFTGHVVNPALEPSLPYDSVADFSYIGTVGKNVMMLVVPKSSPAKTPEELVALGKAKPGGLTTGYLLGSATHMATQDFLRESGLDVLAVPYNSNNQANTDLLGGRLDFAFATLGAIQGQLEAGELRALAISSTDPSALMPDLPPLARTVPGYNVVGWYGLIGPDGIPADRVALLNQTLNEILTREDSAAALAKLGVTPWGGTPDQFREFVGSEIGRWKTVLGAK